MSLKSIIEKGVFQIPLCGEQESFQKMAESCRNAFKLPRLVLVKAQSVWDDLVSTQLVPVLQNQSTVLSWWQRLTEFENIPRPKPPYELMWMETLVTTPPPFSERQRIGAFTQRFEGKDQIEATISHLGCDDELKQSVIRDHPTTLTYIRFLHEDKGCVGISGVVLVLLDADGQYLSSVQSLAIPQEELATLDDREKDSYFDLLRMREGWILHTFARMNCANVKLVPIPNGWKPKHKHARPPSSVWHTIEVSEAPTTRYAGRPAAAPGDVNHIRFHWVRGHYADYTKGKGLFGNPKLRKLFWVPEHTSGSPELGTVVSEYVVQ